MSITLMIAWPKLGLYLRNFEQPPTMQTNKYRCAKSGAGGTLSPS